MRKANIVCFSLVLLALLASPALAQFQFMGGGVDRLITNKSVQDELKLSQDQVGKVKDIGDKIQAKFNEERTKLRELSQEERIQKIQAINKAVGEETYKQLKDVLSADQVKRLKQIEMQQRGIGLFNDADIQKTLKMTDEQKAKFKTMGEDADKAMRGVRQGITDLQGFQEAFKKMGNLRKEYMEKARDALDSEQKKQLKEMVGEWYDLKPEFRRPGGS